MHDDTRVRAALISAAKDFLRNNQTITTDEGDISGLPFAEKDAIAWENEAFNAYDKNFWASVFYVPNQPSVSTLGNKGKDLLTGFMQIDFNVPENTGDKTQLSWEKKAGLYFYAGRSFSNNDQTVVVTSAGVSQGRNVNKFWRKSLTVAFRSHIKRPVIT